MPDLAKDLSPVIEALSKKFGVGRDFVACYLKYLLRESKLKADDLRRPDSMPLPWSMWIQYALSTNSRGLSMYHNLKPHLSRGASRHLDIGAGFGGCVHAFTESGFDSVGIEIDPSRVEFSQANLSELGKEGQIHSLDILSNEVFELGAFDVITCTDVIEHVLDPELALENMIRLLNDNGILYLQIPNKDSIHFIGSDGHFSMFGITLLDRHTAIQYHRLVGGSEYDVGYYFELPWYISRLRDLGCMSRYADSPEHEARGLKSYPSMLKTLCEKHCEYKQKVESWMPETISRAIEHAYLDYMARLTEDARRAHRRSSEVETFRRRYLTDFWCLISRKKKGLRCFSWPRKIAPQPVARAISRLRDFALDSTLRPGRR